jgi:hypothetical protein
VGISHVKVCRRLPRRAKALLAMTQQNKMDIFELNIFKVRDSNPRLTARWSDVFNADFESVILNFELELLN